MSAAVVYDNVAAWSAQNDPAFHTLFTRNPEKSQAFLAIGRGGKKPRKDIALWTDVKPYMDFLFDELFQPDYTLPQRVNAADAKAILADFAGVFGRGRRVDQRGCG